LTVNELVKVKDKVSTVGDDETTISVHVCIPQILKLRHHLANIKDNTVANDVELVGIQHAAREKVERELLAVNNKSVASVGTSVEAGNDIIATSHDIDELTLTFITPLGTKDSSQTGGLTMNILLGRERPSVGHCLGGGTLDRAKHLHYIIVSDEASSKVRQHNDFT
jgi:hypothetical protein